MVPSHQKGPFDHLYIGRLYTGAKNKMAAKLRLGVLVSGGGTNLQSIIDTCESGKVDAEVAVVISNRADAYALERARRHRIPAVHVRVGATDSPEYYAADEQHVALLREHSVGLVCMAGYLRKAGPGLLSAFPGAVMNIHPALLPAFPGVEVQWKAVEYGVRISGCTVHFADEEFDHGPIIIQAAVPVADTDDGDALAKRILRHEHRIYPQAIQWFAQGRLRIEGRHVRVEGAALGAWSDGALISPALELDL
jgi:phosphoribosylglycinamide formyltransferase-1